MRHIPVVMYLPRLDRLPRCPLPDGYQARLFRPGDEAVWAEIEAAAGEFEDTESALQHFEQEFGGHSPELESRCFFLITDAGEPVGTGTAWFNPDFDGEPHGRVHWIAIAPKFQGKGLGRPLVGLVMERLALYHDKAYLTTQTTSLRAIRIYLDFGFVPLITDEQSEVAWELAYAELRHPALLAPKQLRDLRAGPPGHT